MGLRSGMSHGGGKPSNRANAAMKGTNMILGIEDKYVALAYLLCIGSTLLCVLYGLIAWNRGKEAEVKKEDMEWADAEKKIEEEL